MICRVRILAERGPRRSIARCDCGGGTVHIVWDIATMHLGVSDFLAFASSLDAGRSAESAGCPVRIGTVALELGPADHAELSELVATALPLLARPPGTGTAPPAVTLPN